MPREREKPIPVVVAKIGGIVLDRTVCDTQASAHKVIEESKEKDSYGWFATYEVLPMTRSELAYFMLA